MFKLFPDQLAIQVFSCVGGMNYAVGQTHFLVDVHLSKDLCLVWPKIIQIALKASCHFAYKAILSKCSALARLYITAVICQWPKIS